MAMLGLLNAAARELLWADLRQLLTAAEEPAR
jgi:hypothetical protein